ncbi:sigma-70 family RNA polymerase sigma factor [soil metagenome]
MYRTEAGGLIRFLRRRLGGSDEAEDLAQEAFARFLRASPATQIQTPQAYLRRIACNLLKDRAERVSTKISQMSVSIDQGLDQPGHYDQHRELAAREELAHYQGVLEQLEPRTLEIFLLHRVEGYTHKEIAQRLGMNIWNVKRKMVKAIAHIDQHRRDR